MSFVDKVNITVVAGDGGNGKLSFRREKFISKGGPNGGDGGNGADIVLEASRNQNTLAAFRYQKEVRAESGQPGDKNNMHGRSAKNNPVKVPVGTIATNEEGEIVADLIKDGQQAVVAKGGRGGFGNAHFVSSRRQTPKFAEKGEPGEKFDLHLELKMIADVGLVGLPNAGKSTLLSKLSNARPEIADYPFTTLMPNLGVVDIDKSFSILMADIPGLIEGASGGKGLGHDFLRHIERTAVILHLVDAYSDDIAGDYKTIRNELKAYQTDLTKRPEVIAITKVEGLDQEMIDDLIKQLRKSAGRSAKIFAISAQAGNGIKEMLYAIQKIVTEVRNRPEELAKAPPAIPVLRITDKSGEWHVTKRGAIFLVTGENVEKFARRTDFENEEGVQRLRHIMQKMGIFHQLIRQGIAPGDVIQIGSRDGHHFEY